MATLPDYLTDQTEETILQRMLDALPGDIDKSEGSFARDALAPVAAELAQAAIWAQQVLERGFAQTTFGDYLDYRADERGMTRRAAVKATGKVTFTGTNGTVIAAGTVVTTTSSQTALAIRFTTDAQVTIGAGGTVDANITAVEAGDTGNVVAGTITLMETPISGVTSVTNAAATSGGEDEESDESLLTRLLARVRSTPAGGNKADYENWAMEVTGVGAVRCFPVEYGPGTVSISIVDTNKEGASQPLVDQVQDYIAAPHKVTKEAESLTIGGSGTSVDTTQTDDSGDSVKMEYNASGNGTIRDSAVAASLAQVGIWQVRAVVKVDSTAGNTDLLQVGMWNTSGGAWCKTEPNGSTDSVATKKASDLTTAFAEVIVEFYWNGTDSLELRIDRLTSDTATIVWVDQAKYISTFSKDTGEGKAPIGAKVSVHAATPVTITVSATLTIASGYDAATVKDAAEEAIRDYLKSLALASDNDVRYGRIGKAILDTPGVTDYTNLLVNGGTANVTIADEEVAKLGTVTFS